MGFLSKKNLLVLSAGAMLCAGIMNPFIANASPEDGFEDGPNPAFRIGQQQIEPDKIAENFSTMCGVDKKEVIAYMNEGVRFKDISMGAFVAKASGQSLKKVMDVKMENPDWRGVTKALGVSEEKMKETHNEIVSTMFEDNLDIPKETSLSLLQKGYQSRDIAIANAFANDTKKSIADVLDMKKVNNRWEDVATSLGINEETFRKDMDNLRTAIFQHGQFYRE